MIELSIHHVKSITSELKHFEKNDQHEAFSIKILTTIDAKEVKTTIYMYADTNQGLGIQ
jgi:hypothetical protein